MALSPGLVRILDKLYDPSTLVELRHGNLDVSFKTDEHGHPIIAFVGERDEHGV